LNENPVIKSCDPQYNTALYKENISFHIILSPDVRIVLHSLNPTYLKKDPWIPGASELGNHMKPSIFGCFHWTPNKTKALHLTSSTLEVEPMLV